MASTFTANLNYEQPGDGDADWGTALNNNLDQIDTDLGSEHVSGGAHGPKVTIDQPNADNALVIDHGATAVAIDINKTAGDGNVLDITNSGVGASISITHPAAATGNGIGINYSGTNSAGAGVAVSYTHLRAHETDRHLVCRLLLVHRPLLSVSYTHLTLPTK